MRVAENTTGEGAYGTLKPAQIAQLNGNGGGVGPGIDTGNGAGPGPFDLAGAIPDNFWGFLMLVMGLRR